MRAPLLPVRTSGSAPGPALLLLHAFALDGSAWDGVREALGHDGPQVLAPDLPGCGAAPVPDAEPSLDLLARALLDLLDAREVERFVPVGMSMGGYVALALARLAPDRLAGIGLVGTTPAPDDDAALRRRRATARTLDREGTPRVLVEGQVPGLVGATTHAERQDLLARVAALVGAAPADGAAWCSRAMAARPDSRPLLPGLDVPALVVVGQEDGLTPPEVARATASALPGAELVELSRAGHLAPLEEPALVASVLGGWWRRRVLPA